jgi:hypothetical protein
MSQMLQPFGRREETLEDWKLDHRISDVQSSHVKELGHLRKVWYEVEMHAKTGKGKEYQEKLDAFLVTVNKMKADDMLMSAGSFVQVTLSDSGDENGVKALSKHVCIVLR